jgi:DNA-binding transcriptional MocR family regulator
MDSIALSRTHADGLSLVDQIVQGITQVVADQELRPGMAIPSVRQFAKTHGVSTFTVSLAYQRLVAQGVLTARPGSGYRVAPRPRPAPATSRQPTGWKPPLIGESWLLADIFADHSIPIKAGCGWLPADWMNEAGVLQAIRQASQIKPEQLAGYGHPYGYHPLREQVAASLEQHGLLVDADHVLLCQGATQGLDIVARTLLRPGDTVAVESPGYANLLLSLRLAGFKLIGIERNQDGLCLESLQRAASRHHVKALFLNPVLQNPTGASLSMANAFRVLQLAEKHDFWIIEDDVSRDLLPGNAPMLAALAGIKRVVYVSGFSKSITPSMRVGYIVAEPQLLQVFAKTKMALGLTSPELMERTVHQVLRQGRHRRHLLNVQDRLRQAHDDLGAKLTQHQFEVFSEPRAGLFLWARPRGRWREQGSAKLAQLALEDGIWLAPQTYFQPESIDQGWLRFNVAYSLHPALWQFMQRVGADR